MERIPRDEDEELLILSFDAFRCDDESDQDVEALARVKDTLHKMLARAVRLDPSSMAAYVAYSSLALNPHSDYAVQMRQVCRHLHRQFTQAVEGLPKR